MTTATERKSRVHTTHAHVPPSANPLISDCYNGATLTYRVLRATNWGTEFMNLGYFSRMPGAVFFYSSESLPKAQRALANRAVQLMEVKTGHAVLDVACGRGGSSFILRHSTPAASVHAIDLLHENIAIAHRLFPSDDRLSYQQGDAQNIPFEDGTFDRVLCCEAAFHFPDRGQFLAQAARVMRPGGRLVVVDFAWRSTAHRETRNTPEGKIVRRVWEWDDMSTKDEYAGMAARAGLQLTKTQDWTRSVTEAIQRRSEFLLWMTKRPFTRRILFSKYPNLNSFTAEDWENYAVEVKAHRYVNEQTSYLAMVFDKPAGK